MNSTVYSDLEEFIDPSFLESITDEQKDIVPFKGPPKLQIEDSNQSYLKHKRLTIQILLSSCKNNNCNIDLASSRLFGSTSASASISSNINLPIYQQPINTIQRNFEKNLVNNCTINCARCLSIPFYTIEQLKTNNNGRRLIGQYKLIKELARHNHPKSRKMSSKKLRTTEEASNELLEHYRQAHNLD